VAERLPTGTQGSSLEQVMPWELKAPWSDSVLSGVGLDVSRFSTSSQKPEFTSVATAVLVIALCAGLLRLFDRLPHLKPWRRRNPTLSSVAELRKRLRPPRVAAPAVTLVLPSSCIIVPGGAETQAAIDPAGVDAQVTPALVFVNRKSGGHAGEVLLSCFSDLLNPLQVWDLSDGGPRDALTLFRRVPNLRILACGGDGTIGWVAEAVHDANLAPGAALCPVPLGTGNDFARALGWGGGFDGDTLASVGRLLHTIASGYTSYIDRWQVAQVSPPEHTTVTVGRRPHIKTVAITNAHLAAEGSNEKLFLHWEFRTQHHDIAFEVIFTPDGNYADKQPSPCVVHARQRLAAHESPVLGKLPVEHTGTFELRWDNSYSRLRRKHLTQRVWLSSTNASTPPSNSAGRGQSSMTTEARTAEAVANGAGTISEAGIAADSVKSLVMNNYLGIGVDAEVTLAFHRLRMNNPKLFSNRIINKIGYLWIGAKLSLRRYINPAICGGMGDKVRLFADGKRIDLPAGLSGIIILNLPSFGGGLDMWVPQSGQEWSPQSINDGRVEVIGVNSSLDIALQGGLASLGMQVAVRLAQAKAVRLELKSHTTCSDKGGSGSIAVQCDGEPWLSKPGSTIAVANAGHTPVVRPCIHEGHDVVRIVDDVILQATRDGLIGEEQRIEIAQRLAACLPD
jgi:hypothetical protein